MDDPQFDVIFNKDFNNYYENIINHVVDHINYHDCEGSGASGRVGDDGDDKERQ
jgi:hypothetical protein